MTTMRLKLRWPIVVLAGAAPGFFALAGLAQDAWDGKIVQYGTMHESVGMQQSEGRVALSDIARQPHFFGVAALAKLKGEVTFFDSTPVVTGVGGDGKLEAMSDPQLQATILAGASVPAWNEYKIPDDTPPAAFDDLVRDMAAQAGVDVTKPFVFVLEGAFSDVRLHVINGACPMHARMQKIEIPEESKPFEADYGRIDGRVVGLYAKDAVGKLTHPATSTHLHLIFQDEESGGKATGHVEALGVLKGAVLKLPVVG